MRTIRRRMGKFRELSATTCGFEESVSEMIDFQVDLEFYIESLLESMAQEIDRLRRDKSAGVIPLNQPAP